MGPGDPVPHRELEQGILQRIRLSECVDGFRSVDHLLDDRRLIERVQAVVDA
jgi:hypothetical protein